MWDIILLHFLDTENEPQKLSARVYLNFGVNEKEQRDLITESHPV